MRTVYYSDFGNTTLPFNSEAECLEYENQQKTIFFSGWVKYPDSEGWWWNLDISYDCDPQPEFIFSDQLPGQPYDKGYWENSVWAKMTGPPPVNEIQE